MLEHINRNLNML